MRPIRISKMFLDGENLYQKQPLQVLKLGWTVVDTIMYHPDYPLRSQVTPVPTLNILAADGSDLCPSLGIAFGGRTLLHSRFAPLLKATSIQ